MNAFKVFFVDDDPAIRLSMQQMLELEDIDVQCFASGEVLFNLIDASFNGMVITDFNMPSPNGLEILERIQQIDVNIPVVLITGHGDISMAVEAMRNGAYDFIEKPYETEPLLEVIHRAAEKRLLTLENRDLKSQLKFNSRPGPRVLGHSKAMKQVFSVLDAIVDTSADVLLHGETGCGKDLIARWLHEASSRKDHNYVAINCGAVPENLIESELFGHEAGAFTGADKKRIGKFEHADGGTVFLDEIESMPLNLQVKLLRVLEERKVERLGSNKSINLDIRIITATKTNLKELSDRGEFRADLYYRLNIVKVDIPTLKDRIQDVPLLFQHFVLIAAARYDREIIHPPEARISALLQHDWPGNVRELRNLAERYVLMGESAFDQLADPFERELQSRNTLAEMMDQYEAHLIAAALRDHQGSIKDTLVALGLARKTLYEKMKKYGLDKNDYKNES
ncbi:sigma-54-dependent transcriptional regulator [Gynuella sunshinyii]|uniref:Response regulator containing CheY-like receiver, AAA-type ATPase, and DNA-binding domain n=1 Tax=Gynuella sunshinyii YC6258 TaxID=1445510 RepID=A0A0C5UYS0_9GAMM|nr:sigma-54 dependent transcriptional regulator [Gynuella sunshinyii]AJQ92470.1 response regulator containing CheY-like receiver, AAA-type ATPase, and DNA-binding domain [Gynuella sunshinyii YC6258]